MHTPQQATIGGTMQQQADGAVNLNFPDATDDLTPICMTLKQVPPLLEELAACAASIIVLQRDLKHTRLSKR